MAGLETDAVPSGSAVGQVLQRFERSMIRVDNVLYGYPDQRSQRTRVGRESPHEDLLRSVLVLLEQAFLHTVIRLIAIGAPAAVRAGRPGRLLLEWAAADPAVVLEIAVADDPAAGLTELCERRLRQGRIESATDIEILLREVLDCPFVWNDDSEQNRRSSSAAAGIDHLLSRAHAITREADLLGGGASKPLDTAFVRNAAQQATAALHQLASGLLACLPTLGAPSARPSATARADVELVRATRAWARQQDIPVSSHGRPSRDLIARYLSSQETT